MLNATQAVEQARILYDWRRKEQQRLDRIYQYWRGKQDHPFIPRGVPQDVRKLAKTSRVNILGLIVDSVAQSLFIDGYRGPDSDENAEQWRVWEANRMASGQTEVNRAAIAYGVSYTVVVPGDPAPKIRSASPRKMTTLYGEDDFPLWGLLETGRNTWRLYDSDAVYFLGSDSNGTISDPRWTFIEAREHGMGLCPIVRHRPVLDLDGDLVGEVEPLIPLQDQIDFTTFDLLVAQHYGAFRQRYILGWTAKSEEQLLKASAARIMTFKDGKNDGLEVGEFGETTLTGYLDSREATIRHAASLSQTPAHELLGQLVNMSAEALVAAETSKEQKVDERKMTLGDSNDLTFDLISIASGMEPAEDAHVKWRDTSARSFAATVDALGKLAQMLRVPVEVLWEKIPGFTQADLELARAKAAEGNALANLAALLDGQAGDQPPPAA